MWYSSEDEGDSAASGAPAALPGAPGAFLGAPTAFCSPHDGGSEPAAGRGAPPPCGDDISPASRAPAPAPAAERYALHQIGVEDIASRELAARVAAMQATLASNGLEAGQPPLSPLRAPPPQPPRSGSAARWRRPAGAAQPWTPRPPRPFPRTPDQQCFGDPQTRGAPSCRSPPRRSWTSCAPAASPSARSA